MEWPGAGGPAYFNRLYWFGVVGLCTLGLDWGGLSALGMSVFLNRFYWFGVVGPLYTWGQLAGEGLLIFLHWVDVHSSIL